MHTYIISQYEDFKIFQPSKRAIELCSPLIATTREANEQYLSDNPQNDLKMRITGSFIYAHAPNYPGKTAHHWTREQWRELFIDFRNHGLDTAIFQAALWNELNECYYKTNYFTEMTPFNVLEPMLEAAKDENIKIFLGGYGSVTCLSENITKKMVENEKKRQLACFKELLKYRNFFDGFYFVSEAAYMGERNSKKETFHNSIYRELFEKIKETDPDLLIMTSPVTMYFPDKNEEMVDALLAMYENVPIDIMAPQDSVGTCLSLLKNHAENYSNWSKVCKTLNFEFWSNIEIFQRVDLTRCPHSVTASVERVTAQINHAAPYVKKLICWEAPYFLFTEMGNDLRQKLFINN